MSRRWLQIALIGAFFVATLRPVQTSDPAFVINGAERQEGQADLSRPGMLRSPGPPTWMPEAKTGGNLTIELTFETATVEQFGPARILTISANLVDRNLTIGQQGDHLIVRLRRNADSGNGQPEFIFPGAIRAGTSQHLRLSIRQKAMRLDLDGEPLLEARFPTHPLQFWDPAFPLALGNELTWNRPWLGSLREARITTSGETIDLLADGALVAPAWALLNRPVLVSSSAVDLLLNLLMAIPLGYLSSHATRRDGVHRVVLLWLPVVMTAEIAQLFIAGRFASLSDVLLNLLGVTVGATLAARPSRQ